MNSAMWRKTLKDANGIICVTEEDILDDLEEAEAEIDRLRAALEEAVNLVVYWQSGGVSRLIDLYEDSPEMHRLREALKEST
jgi:cyanophycinase-like exopeptidase